MLYCLFTGEAAPSRKEEATRLHRLAWRLLDAALRWEAGVPLSALHAEKGPHGKPRFTDHPMQFSLSHTAGLVCCGLSPFPLGVDCEACRPVSDAVIRRVCTAEELRWLEESGANREEAFIARWTLKESLMKLRGRGLSLGFENAVFSFREGLPVSGSPGVLAATFTPAEGFALSVCTEGGPLPEGPITVTTAELEKALQE